MNLDLETFGIVGAVLALVFFGARAGLKRSRKVYIPQRTRTPTEALSELAEKRSAQIDLQTTQRIDAREAQARAQLERNPTFDELEASERKAREK